MNICMYFQIHQPYRAKPYTVFDIGNSHEYFDEEKNKSIIQNISQHAYLQTNKLLLKLIKKHNFKVTFSISGTALEQFESYAPEVITSLKELYATGKVEFCAETYYHSLSFLYSKKEFIEQIKLHQKKLKSVLGVPKPKIFRNTELIYNNELAQFIEGLKYKGILAEGAHMEWQSPNYVHTPYGCKTLRVLTRNYHVSDDIAFRFSNEQWEQYPLTAPKYEQNISNQEGDICNIWMDYETFGEHHKKESGIWDFFNSFVQNTNHTFLTASDAIKIKTKGELDISKFSSWADTQKDTSAWQHNKLQQTVLEKLYQIEPMVKKDPIIFENWRKLTTSDHYYYMSQKWFDDGAIHSYFNPYQSPYDAFIILMNIMNDMIVQTTQKTYKQSKLKSTKKEVKNV